MTKKLPTKVFVVRYTIETKKGPPKVASRVYDNLPHAEVIVRTLLSLHDDLEEAMWEDYVESFEEGITRGALPHVGEVTFSTQRVELLTAEGKFITG